MSRLRSAFLLVAAGLLLTLAVGHPAAAQSGFERIDSFDSTIVINKDGSADVTEVIAYNFGSTSRHGIERFIPTVFDWTGEAPKGSLPGARFDRVTPLENISVSASPGTPDDVDTSYEQIGGVENTKIRIGDPDTTITGQHTYTIRYRLEGVLNGFADHDELYLNITGNGWSVPIGSTTATVSAPGAISRVTCFAGPVKSVLPCDSSTSTESATAGQATFSQGALGSGDGLTVVVGLPKGVDRKSVV